MGRIPEYSEAMQLLREYNKEDFHIKHALIVSGVMGYFAQKHDSENIGYWELVGLLHDLDFERYPERHCEKSKEIMETLEYDKAFIEAVVSHGYGLAQNDIKPEKYMEKVLFAVDELTGLIGAVAIMRPSKSVADLELKSVMKKFKTLSFAAGVSREVIRQGAELMGIPLEQLITETIFAMRSLPEDIQK